MVTISLNGADGCGKSTHARFLKYRIPGLAVFGSLSQYGNRWPKVDGAANTAWWFEQVPIESLVEIMSESLTERTQAAKRSNADMCIFDRGIEMYQAVAAATWVTREKQITLPEALEMVKRIFARNGNITREDRVVLMEPSKAYFESAKRFVYYVRRSVDHEHPAHLNEIYRCYQDNLKAAIDMVFNEPSIVRMHVQQPFCIIHDRLCGELEDVLTKKLPGIADTIESVVGLSGPSESGKSSAGELLRLHHGYCRLKIRYFVSELKDNMLDVETTILRLLDFLRIHHFAAKSSVESLHGPVIPAFLKLCLGQRFKLVYIDAPWEVRVARTAHECNISFSDAEEVVRIKDTTKRGRGLDEVATLADVVINNDASETVLDELLENALRSQVGC